MRIKSLGQPVLGGSSGVGTGQHFHHVGLGLVVLDDASGPAEIVAHQMRDEIETELPNTEVLIHVEPESSRRAPSESPAPFRAG